MKMMREKMRISRKKSEQRPISLNMELKHVQIKPKTLRGQRLLEASRMENSKIQKSGEKIIVGADI